MPLRFWKKDKPQKGKDEGEAEESPKEKPTEGAKEKAPPAEEKEPKPEGEGKKGEPKLTAKSDADVESVVGEIHAKLVDLGLTVPPTKGVFAKRVTVYPGGEKAFVAAYREEPHRAVTRVLADWLGFRIPEQFELEKLLEQVNLRLSSFKLTVQAKDLTWLDKELNLRKARLVLGEQEKVVRFKDARDFLKGVNELVASKRLAFLELETWADDFAFFLAREPKWDKLATTELVVVKADQTARGGECGECGAPVGKYWSDCLKCGAVFD